MAIARILLVEDEKLTLNFLTSNLTQVGYDVHTAQNGNDGLKLFETQAFDLVISDVNMPGMDGLEMVRKIRAIDPTIVPIIITARQDQETAIQALEMGVHHFLGKPFELEDLEARLSDALEEHHRIVETRLLMGDLLQTRSSLQRQLKEHSEKLTHTERYLHHMIDAAPFGVISTNREGRVLTFNDKAAHLYGYTANEIIGRHITVLFGETFTGEQPTLDTATHIKKDGTPISLVLHARDIHDETGQHMAHLYILEDRSERAHLENQLFHAERLSLLGQMAPRIAHEFKTPLQIIGGNAELTQMFLKQEKYEKAFKASANIEPAVKKVNDMVKQLTNIGKPETNRQEFINLATELDAVMDTLQPLGIVKYCSFERHYDSELPTVWADASQIEQVFRNLIVNAAQAMEESTQKKLVLSVCQTNNLSIRVSISDTGHGIPKAALEKIFYPFYTTKPEGKGTGLGLSIVKSILDRHKATLEVKSAVGEGTTFILTFPISVPTDTTDCEDTPQLVAQA